MEGVRGQHLTFLLRGTLVVREETYSEEQNDKEIEGRESGKI